MKTYSIFAFAALCLLIACSPGNNAAKGIRGILKRSDCKGECHKVMGCEGKSLTLELLLANNNVMVAGNTIFARDPEDFDYTIKIEFDNSVPLDVYGDIKNPANKRCIVTGIVEGYDQYVHEQCTRSYIIKVSKAEDFKVYSN